MATHYLGFIRISDFGFQSADFRPDRVYLEPMASPEKILVVQPSWVGDAVMATPTLRAVREHYPAAHISYLLRRYVKPLYSGMPWADQLITYRTEKTKARTGKGLFDIAARLRSGHFDLGDLLTNSFKTALMCKMGNIPRVVGYDRDGRGFLLTDKLISTKDHGSFRRRSSNRIWDWFDTWARNTATWKCSCSLLLRNGRGGGGFGPLRPRHRHSPARVDRKSAADPAQSRRNYGAAKCWRAEYFAQLADRLIEQHQATILISAAPKERAIVDAVKSQMKHAAIDLSDRGVTLGSLKEIVRRCDLMITNDTGPRHIAAAMNVPVVTIFGPTFPEWTEIYYPKERQVSVKVFCGPCQKKICPLDHRCMTQVTPAMVYDAAMELLTTTRQTK